MYGSLADRLRDRQALGCAQGLEVMVTQSNAKHSGSDAQPSSASAADLAATVADDSHALSNVLGVIQLTTDLLDRAAVDRDEATRMLRDQVTVAGELMTRLRSEVHTQR